MENVVPGALQRLRAADIIRMAGLATAARGQEYCRLGVVHNTQRQGVTLTGTVEVPHTSSGTFPSEVVQHKHTVTFEIQSPSSWTCVCSCGQNTKLICIHAAALLYQWLARPTAFLVEEKRETVSQEKQASEDDSSVSSAQSVRLPKEQDPGSVKVARSFSTARQLAPRGLLPSSNLVEVLAQMGLSELRSMAREYEVVTNGLNKQQLAEAIQEALKQPEAVRRVASTLEKPQRQLLAALTLVGGSMTDEDLRGLFERFSLGHPNQLQATLQALQSKALLFRTNLNSLAQQRVGMSGALLDIGWYTPVEVCAALRVMVPVTPFDLERRIADGEALVVELADMERMLADLLLVARALDGYQLSFEEEKSIFASPFETVPRVRNSSSLESDGSVILPPPSDLPSTELLAAVRKNVDRPLPFLRFAFRLLRLADILHKDDNGTPYVRILPNVTRLLLGTGHLEAGRDLFELWLAQSSYEDLIDLQEHGVRIRSRSTSLNLPLMRSGELEMENSEARQAVLALLSQAPLMQWINFNAFARFVYRLNPLFLQKRQRLFSSPHWWLEQGGRILRPLQLSDWQRAEMHYLAHLLAGPLHWWGMCDIIRGTDGQLLAFRLTAATELFFGGFISNEQNQALDYYSLADSLEIVDTGEVLVSCSAHTWPLVQVMETFMEAMGVRQERLCYLLTPKALGIALSQGHHPDILLDLLRYLAQARGEQQEGPLSAMIAQLERWIASYGRARIYTGVTLLEVADAAIMRELSATTSLDEQVIHAIHPNLLILKKAGAERIADDLKRRGQSPLIHNEEFYGTD